MRAALALLAAVVLSASAAWGQPPAAVPAAPALRAGGNALPPWSRTTAQAEKPQVAEPEPQPIDVFDLLRMLRHKNPPPAEQPPWDPTKRMVAFAPIIGYKPTSGMLFGAGGNVASFWGDPKTTHISSAVFSLTFSTKKQTAITGRFTVFTRDDRWRIEGDNRAQWTSQDSYGLGTATLPSHQINAKYNFFRVYETGYRRLRPGLFAGIGLHYNAHTNIGPGTGTADEAWQQSPYMEYTREPRLPDRRARRRPAPA